MIVVIMNYDYDDTVKSKFKKKASQTVSQTVGQTGEPNGQLIRR